MRLLTIDDAATGSPGALLRSGEILHLSRLAARGTIEAWLPASIQEILEGGQEALDVARRIVDRAEAGTGAQLERMRARGQILGADTRLLAPITRPRVILAAGLAYRSHLAEMAGTPAPAHPTAFLKSTESISPPGGAVLLPAQARDRVDFEGELACVFGRECHQVTAEQALSYVGGYTASNDVSARDWVQAVWSAREPWEARISWEVNLMGKQFPGFTALGPVLTTADEIPDPAQLHLVTRLNEQVMQDVSVSDMIFPLAEVIAHFSRWYRFSPGDVLLTGTPAGVGVGRKPPVFIRSGDVLEVQISRIGCLRTRFVDVEA